MPDFGTAMVAGGVTNTNVGTINQGRATISGWAEIGQRSTSRRAPAQTWHVPKSQHGLSPWHDATRITAPYVVHPNSYGR